jgi:hypothetical protein
MGVTMNYNKFNHHKLGLMSFIVLLTAVFFLQGCVVFLTSVATVVKMRSSNHFTTTVLVKKDPTEVYTAMLRVVDQKRDVEIVSQDNDAYLIEAKRGELHVTAKASEFDSSITQLMVTSDAGESDQTDEDLALNVVQLICDELGVKYKLAEE